jgi:hemoglobin
MAREHAEDQIALPDSPFALLGGRAAVEQLAQRFYDEMERHEPALARLHEVDADGRVAEGPRVRFAMFLVGWLGGPQDYVATHGHPRLRMRHARVPVDRAMRDAWLHAMQRALDAQGVEGPVRAWLDLRFADVADFMRNVEG